MKIYQNYQEAGWFPNFILRDKDKWLLFPKGLNVHPIVDRDGKHKRTEVNPIYSMLCSIELHPGQLSIDWYAWKETAFSIILSTSKPHFWCHRAKVIAYDEMD